MSDLTHPADGTVVLDSSGYAWQFDGVYWCLASMGPTGGRRPGSEFVHDFGPLRVLHIPREDRHDV